MKPEDYGSLLRVLTRQLAAAGIADAPVDAWYLFSYVYGMDRVQYLMAEGDPVPEDGRRQALYDLAQRRCGGEPVQYLLGEASFMGLTFYVTPAVLIPRQDTEVLVETALDHLQAGDRVLDLCTGSGCIILSLAALGPEGSYMGSDLSEAALEVAQVNRDRLGLGHVTFRQGDLFENTEGLFDLIVSNPPYIEEAQVDHLMREVKDHEPRMALAAGEDGLDFYRRITAECGPFLKAGAYLMFEIGCDQAEAVCSLMKENGFENVTVRQDLAGLDRVVYGRKRHV